MIWRAWCRLVDRFLEAIGPRKPKPAAPAIIVSPGDYRVVNVGVNEYLDSPQNSLRGCVPDAHLVRRDELPRGATPIGDPLLDYQATAAAGEERIGNAIADLRSGQDLLVQLSMHGVLADDPAEPDGLMEALAFTDALRDWPNNLFPFSRLARLTRGIADGAFVLFLIDACHSGPNQADAERLRELIANPHGYRKARAFVLPPELQPVARGAVRTLEQQAGVISTSWQNWALLSGCQTDQTSADAYIDGSYQGAMTWSWRAARARLPATSLVELHAEMIATLAGSGYDQDPRLVGRPENLRRGLPSGARLK